MQHKEATEMKEYDSTKDQLPSVADMLKDVNEYTLSAERHSMDDYEILKREINNFLWMHAPETATLKELDELACEILEKIEALKNKPAIPAVPEIIAKGKFGANFGTDALYVDFEGRYEEMQEVDKFLKGLKR